MDIFPGRSTRCYGVVEPMGSAMEHLQVYFDIFGTSAPIRQRQESRVSAYVEQYGETKFWDPHCEVVEEGTYIAEIEEGLESGLATSTSTDPYSEYEADDTDLQIALALSEEDPPVDEELARRLNDLDATPHVPRVNEEIPVESSSDAHQRLLERLSINGLAERKMEGDGNCQFRALSDQLYRTPKNHMFVRQKIVSQLSESQDSYSGYVPMEYNEYLKKMARDGEWGDHVTLQAAADCYGVKICLITSFKDNCFIEIMPAQQKSMRGLYLSFWSEIHYNSIYPLGDVSKKKKKPWYSL